jgi:chloramphenicol 3-O-phosphotransferase
MNSIIILGISSDAEKTMIAVALRRNLAVAKLGIQIQNFADRVEDNLDMDTIC